MGFGETSGTLAKNNDVIREYRNGKDLMGRSRNSLLIDFNDFSQEKASQYLEPFQRVLDTVKPERAVHRDKQRREKWWRFGRSNKKMRVSLQNLDRYIATTQTSKHRVFQFLSSDIIPDQTIVIIAINDAYYLAILSSHIHVNWSIEAGGWLGIGNDSRYNNSVCFERFPFPDPTDAQKQTIRELGDRLDSHRKTVQANHPDITITGMYNLLEKLRKGEPFTDSDRDYNNKALVSTLKQIHDDLDRSVLEAYGWEDLNGEVGIEKVEEMILERLVTLNADRAAEERNGLIRWLRPEYQAPDTIVHAPALPGLLTEEPTIVLPTEQKTWSKNPKDQLTALQDLFRTHPTEWTLAQIAAQFKTGTRNQKSIRDNLDRLEFFGIILHYQTDGLDRWSIALQ